MAYLNYYSNKLIDNNDEYPIKNRKTNKQINKYTTQQITSKLYSFSKI